MNSHFDRFHFEFITFIILLHFLNQPSVTPTGTPVQAESHDDFHSKAKEADGQPSVIGSEKHLEEEEAKQKQIRDWLTKTRKLKPISAKFDPNSIEFTTPQKSQRIPPGATDPDGLWRSQMQNARATMRDAGIPPTR